MDSARRGFILFGLAAAGVFLSSAVSAAASRDGTQPSAEEGMQMISNITAAHFSPTGGTRDVALRFAHGLSDDIAEHDLAAQSLAAHSFGPEDFAVFAVPVFSGRVPARAVEGIRLCKGDATRAVAIAVCGGRAVDDALLELQDVLAGQGFLVMASGAFVARHSMAGEIAAGRPDEKDEADIDAFAEAVLQKYASAKASPQVSQAPQVPGNRPYREVKPSPVGLVVSGACTSCGTCVTGCPVSAVPKDDPRATDMKRCILCMRCIHACPAKARDLPPQLSKMVLENLRKVCPERLENATYL